MHWAVLSLLLLSGCSSVRHILDRGGVPLGSSGWVVTGGADLERKGGFVALSGPWGDPDN